MQLEKFYKHCNKGLINLSALAEILEISLPTIYSRRKTKSFTSKEMLKLISIGMVTPTDSMCKDWGLQVLANELLEDSEEGKLDFTDPVLYELAFDHWANLQKLELHG